MERSVLRTPKPRLGCRFWSRRTSPIPAGLDRGSSGPADACSSPCCGEADECTSLRRRPRGRCKPPAELAERCRGPRPAETGRRSDSVPLLRGLQMHGGRDRCRWVMLIREVSREECFRMLARAKLGRLACARDNQPYVVPVYFAFDEMLRGLYGFTFPGRKVEWMRDNPRVCVEVEEIVADDQWMSVIGIGRYEELPESATSGAPRLPFHECPPDSSDGQWEDEGGGHDERERAWQLLKTIHPVWWEPACTAWAARVHRDPSEPIVPVYFRIRLDHLTGHQATPDAGDASFHAAPTTSRWDRLRGTVKRVFWPGRARTRRS